MRSEAQPEFDATGQFVSLFGVSQDITEQKNIEEELLRERIRAEEANSAKSEFLATISHEIRTPLNAILGFAEIMDSNLLGPLENDKYAEYIRDIRASAGHLLDLVSDILDISAIEAGEFALAKADLDLGEILEECTRLVRGQTRNAEVEIVATPLANTAFLYADRRAIKQILINLLSNAIKFTPKGGRVETEILATNLGYQFSVSDTGIGIPEEVLPVIMLPFERGRQNPHESKDGTGLGLAIVNSLVALHGGNIDIESDIGAGTTVRVRIPVHERAAA